MIELQFPVMGNSIPVDHGYALYGALSRLAPVLHRDESPANIGPIRGHFVGKGELQLTPRSRLRLRVPADLIPKILPLAGQALDLDGHRVRLGVPSVQALVPAPSLIARLVTVKINGIANPTPDQFLDAVRRKLEKAKIAGEAGIPLRHKGPEDCQPVRRIIKVAGKRIVGFALRVAGLSAEQSLSLQCQPPFSRRRMGCAFFVPTKEDEK